MLSYDLDDDGNVFLWDGLYFLCFLRLFSGSHARKFFLKKNEKIIFPFYFPFLIFFGGKLTSIIMNQMLFFCFTFRPTMLW